MRGYLGKNLREILLDGKLAGLGDTYVNFIYSLASSLRAKQPVGVKASGKILAEALKRAGLRELLPSRLDRHGQGDSVEALILYSWLSDIISTDECVSILEKHVEDPVKAFTELLLEVKKRLRYDYCPKK